MMRKTILTIAISGLLLSAGNTHAQSIADCLEQLSLDYQKLAGMKNSLAQLYQGYDVLQRGYSSVQDISKGNFELHRAFLDRLLIAAPAVRNSPAVRETIAGQRSLTKEYASFITETSIQQFLREDERKYYSEVYNRLLSLSLKNTDDLTLVLTSGRVRMNDAERLGVIGRASQLGRSQLAFFHSLTGTFAGFVAREERAGK